MKKRLLSAVLALLGLGTAVLAEDVELYSTDFSDWDAIASSTTPTVVNKETNFSEETLTFTLSETQVVTANINTGKFGNAGGAMCAKTATPYIETSQLKSVTTVKFTNGATGSSRGWKLLAKGDGDVDWVTVLDEAAAQNATTWQTANVNRTNVALKFMNRDASQNAYMFNLQINGEVDLTSSPNLKTFKLNGTECTAATLFKKNGSGDYEGTIKIGSSATMISESNPLTEFVTYAGVVGTVVYDNSVANTCKVTIPVTKDAVTKTYILNVVLKPLLDVTFLNTDGTTIGTQQVEQDASFGTFTYGAADVTASSGCTFRGWVKEKGTISKVKTSDVVTEAMTLYPYESKTEKVDATEDLDYNFMSADFDAADHEALTVACSQSYNGAQHGWDVKNGSLKVYVHGPAVMNVYNCKHTSNAIAVTYPDGTTDNVPTTTTDGAVTELNYTGSTAGDITLTFNGQAYLHKIEVFNGGAPYTVSGNTITVNKASGLAFLAALDKANTMNASASSESERTTIVLQDGTYDLGNRTCTPIKGNYISIKGQSMDNTIIVNKALVESINATATLQNANNVKYTMIENLTLQNAYEYKAGQTGRAVVFQDRGMNTIMKKVKMLSYQDTYYSNVQTASANLYFEDCEIHGTVDYICGGGNAFFEHCTLVNEAHEGDYIVAYQGTGAFGYVFNNCTIDAKPGATYYFGRTWGGTQRVRFLNSIMTTAGAAGIINGTKGNRWLKEGMKNDLPTLFGEYNTMDESSTVISPASNVVTFKNGSNTADLETILTAEQAAEATRDKVFASDAAFLEKILSITSYATAVEETEASDAEVVSSEYYTLNGNKVVNPGAGIFVKKNNLSDGTFKSEVILK